MIAVIIQARMGSTRLPGKILKKILGKTMIEHMIERVKRSKSIDKIILATTLNKEDAGLSVIAKRQKIDFYRGSEKDVLDRYYQAAKKFKADVVVRVTGDCPLIDSAVVDRVVNFYKKNMDKFDYVDNVLPPTFPDGMDVEVFSFSALERAWREAKLPSEREHVDPYIIYHPEIFRLGSVRYKKDISNLRLTVDNPEDLTLVRDIFKFLYKKNKRFSLEDILVLEKEHPEMFRVNRHLERSDGYLKSLAQDGEIAYKKPAISADFRLDGERIYLRRLRISDTTEKYVRWLNDPEINQYLESRFSVATLNSVKDYIGKVSGDSSSLSFAIIRKDNNNHIGNIKIGSIDPHHKTADMGIMIGDRNSWGKGYATEAIKILSDYAFNDLGMRKMTAGAYENNLGSIKAFIKAGFRKEGAQKKQYLCKDGYVDSILMAKFSS